MARDCIALLRCMSPEAIFVQTGKGGQGFLHMLISKGHNEPLKAVLNHLQDRFNWWDFSRMLQMRNHAGRAVVDMIPSLNNCARPLSIAMVPVKGR